MRAGESLRLADVDKECVIVRNLEALLANYKP
jgi:hypothetical protein